METHSLPLDMVCTFVPSVMQPMPQPFLLHLSPI
uniref:Uncharacterized protein n=1 Tax=Anguilla anguilla TaxID=7936 RepID=A0A0E9R0R9_ANGAN